MPWQLLQTLPGVDRWSATAILIEIGTDMSQFGNIQQFASWAGLCPGNNESAGKRKSGKTRKGNRSLRHSLCEVANAASRTTSQFKVKYQGLVIRRGHKRTIISLDEEVMGIWLFASTGSASDNVNCIKLRQGKVRLQINLRAGIPMFLWG
ncbi:MAG: IS110 family transposase [Gammaproteobacteria bacterium]|uniref:IS110 family transposase n=1 Tax=Candidatus Thiopontia autotrophica TaxID=2841688 RepID=A0A8J6PBM3_9GAMM|nr:IS110 family transposase [Candidatus Thiopontia autotrophica]MBL6968836.1 IS110 family transposase [Gammaproteobacteria bacterium]